MTTLAPHGLRATALFQCTRAYAYTPLQQHQLLSQSFRSLRHASTTNSTKISRRVDSINAPDSTFPALLNIPERLPNQSFFPTYALALGKAYLTFYKTGVKNIWRNFQLARKIKEGIASEHSSSIRAAVSSGRLSRSDFQVLHRNSHDIKRVPIFALVVLVCGEFTPLVVIAISNIVPWTCRIPKQIENDRKKLEKRRAISFRNLTSKPPTEKGVNKLNSMQLLHISRSVGLSSSIWDVFGGPPSFLLSHKVQKRVEYLDLDDSLIRRSGGVGHMNLEELKVALVDRGLDVLGKTELQLREYMIAWLEARDKASIERLILTRPSVWPVLPKKKRS